MKFNSKAFGYSLVILVLVYLSLILGIVTFLEFAQQYNPIGFAIAALLLSFFGAYFVLDKPKKEQAIPQESEVRT
jgi:TctA family transporter